MLVKFKIPPAQWDEGFAKLGIQHQHRAKEYASFSKALLDAKDWANEVNFPVEVTSNGRSYIIYPEGLRKALKK